MNRTRSPRGGSGKNGVPLASMTDGCPNGQRLTAGHVGKIIVPHDEVIDGALALPTIYPAQMHPTQQGVEQMELGRQSPPPFPFIVMIPAFILHPMDADRAGFCINMHSKNSGMSAKEDHERLAAP